MKNPETRRTLRWTALVSIVLFVGLSNTMDYFTYPETITVISNRYYTLFTPDGYTFSIWGLIYLSWVFYGVYQLLPGERDVEAYDYLSVPVIISSVLGIVWGIVYRLDRIAASLVVIILMLVVAIILFIRVRRAVLRKGYSNWLSLPFSLYAGWLTVATIANAAVYLEATGFDGAGISEVNRTLGMVVLATIIGLVTGFIYRDFIFPATIAWGITGIAVANKDVDAFLMYVCFACAAICAVAALTLVNIYFNYRKRYVPAIT